jgi:cobalamin biosynthesis Mg chelatase CobN
MLNCHLSMSLQVVENRLFSEGLHVLGQPPTQQHMAQYLKAYFDEGLSDDAVSAVVEFRGEGLEAVRCLPTASAARRQHLPKHHADQMSQHDALWHLQSACSSSKA